MRTLKFAAQTALLLNFSILTFSSAQSGAPTDATLAETAAWIETHLVGLSHVQQTDYIYMDVKHKPPRETGRKSRSSESTVTWASMKDCKLMFTYRFSQDSLPFSTDTYKLPVEKLKPVTWQRFDLPKRTTAGGTQVTDTPSSYGRIIFDAQDRVITDNLYYMEDKTTQLNMSDGFGLGVDDEQMALRMVKALNHAIALCHASAKPEPF